MSLNERAMKVTLKRTRPGLTKRDDAAEQFVQEACGDSALVVNKKLFRDESSPVRGLLKTMDELYNYHKNNTRPWVDAGPRLLPNSLYFEYTKGMRERIATMEGSLAGVMPLYDQHIQKDIDWRTEQDRLNMNGKPKPPNYNPPSVADYPTAGTFAEAVSVKLRFETLPDAPDCVFDEDKEEIKKLHTQIEETAKKEAVKDMLEPLRHLATRLEVPIGEKGSIFRNSALENILEGVARARRLTITPDEEIERIAVELEQAVTSAAANVEWLRESPINRENTAGKMKVLASKLDALMV